MAPCLAIQRLLPQDRHDDDAAIAEAVRWSKIAGKRNAKETTPPPAQLSSQDGDDHG
ncbi:hypothetical protein BGZ74_011350, partial [Mortierella antarctica]